MISTPLIDKVEVLDLRDQAGPGNDGLFVAVHGEGCTGWYGPVTAEVARCVHAALADKGLGWPIVDHRAVQATLRQAIGPTEDAAASWALGAVDCATWDLHGKLAGLPVAGLLASAVVTTVPLYASWLRLDLADPTAAHAIAQVGCDRWMFTKWGLRQQGGDSAIEAARLCQAVQAVVAIVGKPAAFDAVFSWDAALARSFADQVDVATLVWVEDPLPGNDSVAYKELSRLLPLAVGERLSADADAGEFLTHKPRAFTLDVVGCGGLTRAIDLIATAFAAGIPVFPHGRSFVPAVHLGAAFPRAVAGVEYRLEWEPIRQRLYAQPWLPQHGQIGLPGTPGLGAAPRSR